MVRSGVDITVDERQLKRMRSQFKNWPQATGRIMRESINRSATKTRKRIIDRIHQLNPSIKKKDIRKSTRFKGKDRATNKRWSATVWISGAGIPLIKFAKKGRKSKVVKQAGVKQSIWLFYNVFRPKYGAAAIFSTSYRIVRKAYQKITTRVNGESKSLQGTGAFIATMKSGHTGIYKRVAGSRAIREMKGPSLSTMLDQGIILKRIKQDAGKELRDDIEKRIERYIKIALDRGVA